MIARVDVHDALRAGARASAGARPRRLRRGLVVAEVALALVLMAGAGLLVRSFRRVIRVEPGFRPDQALTLNVAVPGPIGQEANNTDADRARYARFFREATERLRRLPGIDAAGAIDNLPMSNNDSDNTFQIVDHPRPSGLLPPDEQIRFVTPGYFEAMQIPLLRGRAITGFDRPDRPLAVVITHSFAQTYWPRSEEHTSELQSLRHL